MSSTRTEVLNLLKEFDQQFPAFEGAEESFILSLATGDMTRLKEITVDWRRLAQASFAMGHCYIAIRNGLISNAPDWFLQESKHVYLQQVSANEGRLGQILELSQLFERAGIKVLVVKGAAELAYSPDDVDFLGRRDMRDVDLLCSKQDIEQVDKLLQKHGYVLWNLGLHDYSTEEVQTISLEKYSHYIYNACCKNLTELHGTIGSAVNTDSYPPGFASLLLDQCRDISVREVRVYVPKPEHLIVHLLCHAACQSNNRETVYLDNFYFEGFCKTNNTVSLPVQTNKRLDILQLRFLLQMHNVLERFRGKLDLAEIAQLLMQVPERQVKEMYLLLTSFYFPALSVIHPGASAEAINQSRQRYVLHYIVPLLAERMER